MDDTHIWNFVNTCIWTYANNRGEDEPSYYRLRDYKRELARHPPRPGWFLTDELRIYKHTPRQFSTILNFINIGSRQRQSLVDKWYRLAVDINCEYCDALASATDLTALTRAEEREECMAASLSVLHRHLISDLALMVYAYLY